MQPCSPLRRIPFIPHVIPPKETDNGSYVHCVDFGISCVVLGFAVVVRHLRFATASLEGMQLRGLAQCLLPSRKR